jgi:hypothetical protein
MLRLSRSTVGLVVLVALLSALCEWDGVAERVDDSPLSRLAGPLTPQAIEQGRALDAETARAVARSRRMAELARDVAEGRLSLLEGAARMRDVYRADPSLKLHLVRGAWAGASDDERFCRLTIGWVEGLAWEDRERGRAVVARLRAELDEHLGRGTLRLPE